MDPRIRKLAHILVDYSANIDKNDRVLIEATTTAEPLVRALLVRILERGGQPHLLLDLPDQDDLFFAYATDFQLDFTPTFRKIAYEQFESRIRIGSSTNTRSMSKINPTLIARRQKALAPILQAQMKRGAEKTFRWVSTLFPTNAYAMEAEMSLQEFEEYCYRACHADPETADPV